MFASLDAATRGANAVKTTQLALPQVMCSDVFDGASGFGACVANLAAVSLNSDGVFGNDAGFAQMAAVASDLSAGFSATLTLVIAA